MLKKFTSILLVAVMILSVFAVAPVTSASAASYKDNLINSVLSNQSKWYMDWYSGWGYYGCGTVSFMDLNFDGNLEFIVTEPCGTMRNVSNSVYYYNSSTGLTKATGGDKNEMIDSFNDGSGMKVYYNKSTGGYKILGFNYVHSHISAGGANGVTTDYTMSFDGKAVKLDYYRGCYIEDGKKTYYGDATMWGNIAGKPVSKSKYDSIGKSVTKNCVDAKLKKKTVSLENWKSYSTSKKRSLLSSAYDGYSISTKVVSKPEIKKFEAKGDGVKLTWNAVSGAKVYRIYQKTSSGWKTLATTGSTSIVDKTINVSEKRTYTIKCLSKNKQYTISSYDKEGRTFQYAAAPKITKASSTSSGLKIYWGKASGAVKYRVFIKSGSTWKKLGDTTSTSFTHKGAQKGKKYTYTVRCITSSGKTYTSYFDTTGKTFTKK